MKTIKYILPIYWASYLINEDDSGLESGEKDEIDAFLERENISILDVSDDVYFSWHNEGNNLGGDVAEYTAVAR